MHARVGRSGVGRYAHPRAQWVGTKVGAFVNRSIVYQPPRHLPPRVTHKRQHAYNAYRLRALRSHTAFIGTRRPNLAPPFSPPKHLPPPRHPFRRRNVVHPRTRWVATKPPVVFRSIVYQPPQHLPARRKRPPHRNVVHPRTLWVGSHVAPATHSLPIAPRRLPTKRRRPWRRLSWLRLRPRRTFSPPVPDPFICQPAHARLLTDGITRASLSGVLIADDGSQIVLTPTRAVLATTGVTRGAIICSDLTETPPPPPPGAPATVVMVTA